MLRPRYQKVIADLLGNKVRSLLVLASIAVGLFALGVVATIYTVGLADMQRGFAAINPANIYILASPFEHNLLDNLQSLPEIKQAEGVYSFGTRLNDRHGQWVAVDIQVMKEPGSRQVNQLQLFEGVWPPSDREIVLDQYKLDETHARLGDLILIETPSGKSRPLKLVGIVQDETIGGFGGAGGFFSEPVQGYINQTTSEWLEQTQPRLYNTLYVTVTGDNQNHAYLESVARQIRGKLEENNIQIISSALRSSTEHPNLFLAQAVLAVLLVIGLLVVALSGFLITNTLKAIMNQQVQQIGILKTVGARRGQIAVIYQLLSLLFGLLAWIVAAPLSYLVAFRIVDFLTVEMNYTFFGARIVPPVIILQGLIAVLMPQAAALAPVLQGVHISVQEALSGYRQSAPPNRSRFDRRISGLRSVSMLLLVALRNTFRQKGRLALTLLTLTLGGAVFIATFNVRVSMTMYVDQIIQYFLADVNVTVNRPYRIEEIQSLILEVPGTQRVEGWTFARSELVLEDGSVGESVTMLAPPAGSDLIEPILLQGRWIVPGDRNAIALSELFLEAFPELSVGDTLKLCVNGEESDWTVVGFYQLAGKISGFSAYTSYEYLSELTRQPGKAMSYRVVASRPDLSNQEQEILAQAVESHLAKSGIQVTNTSTGQSLTSTASQGFNILTAFLLFLALLTALVGSIGLTGTMSLNVMERTREIGVLRAVGASDRALMQLVLIEGGLIGLLSWLLACLAAFPISKILSDSISLALFGSRSNFGFTPTGFLAWIVVVIFLSVLASVLPARSATRLTIREVLSYE